MDEWTEASLEEMAQINPSERLTKGLVAKKVPMENILPFTKKISVFSIDEYKGGTKFRNGDTLVARITPSLENGKTAFVDFLNKNEVGFGSTEFIVLREIDGLSDRQYLYYFACSPPFREIAIASMTGSSGRQRVQTEVLKENKFLFPPLPEQRAIAEVLSSLDGKIDLLHRQNQTLEVLAQTLFRQWFIEEAEDDWEEISLFEAIVLLGGGTPKTSEERYWNGEIPWLSGSDISANHKSFVNSTAKTITQEGVDHSSTKLLPKFSTVITARGTVGKYCVLAKPMAFSQTNYGIAPKFENCFFFTYLLIDHLVEELMSAAYGSVFDTITTRTFMEFQINIPSDHEIMTFEEQVDPYFQKMKVNQDQIQLLENLRDTLLPKLMSGEVRVQQE